MEKKSKLALAFHLQTELETFEQLLPKLLKTSLGKFVVINSRKALGIESDYPSALKVGYQACGSEKPFFVELIEEPGITKQKNRLSSLKFGF